jgi:hypothetical protein
MIGTIYAILGLIIGGAVTGGVTFMSMKAREAIVVAGAVSVEKNKGVTICNARVAEIERVQNSAVEQSVGEAIGAANSVDPTPEDKAALIALCKASASCRSRNSL